MNATEMAELSALETLTAFEHHGGLFRLHPAIEREGLADVLMRLWEKSEVVIVTNNYPCGYNFIQRHEVPANQGYWKPSGKGGNRLRKARADLMAEVTRLRALVKRAHDKLAHEVDDGSNLLHDLDLA